MSAPAATAGRGDRLAIERENRGAGAGWRSVPTWTEPPRPAIWGWSGASPNVSTGATQASVAANASAHSSLVTGGEPLGEPLPHRRPGGPVVLGGELPLETQPGQQSGEELRLERAHRHESVVGGAVGGVERRPTVEQVPAAAVIPQPSGGQLMEHGEQRADSVDHGSVHHLPEPGLLPLQQRCQDAHDQVQGPATEVADQVERRWRCHRRVTDRMESTGDGDVGDVVPGGGGERALPAPTGHPAVHQAGVGRQAFGRPDPEALHHPGPHALDEDVGTGHQPQHDAGAVTMLEVDGHRSSIPPHQRPQHVARAARAVHPHHIGTQVAEQHPRHRHRPDRLQFDHRDTVQRAHRRRP